MKVESEPSVSAVSTEESECHALLPEAALSPKRDVWERTLEEAWEQDERQRRRDLLTRVERLRTWGQILRTHGALLLSLSWVGLIWVSIFRFDPFVARFWPVVGIGWVLVAATIYAGERLLIQAGTHLGLNPNRKSRSIPSAEQLDQAIAELRDRAT